MKYKGGETQAVSDRECMFMKQESYVKVSEFVRRFRYGEAIVKYENSWLTRIVYVAFLVFLAILLWQRDERIVRVVLVCGVSFILVSVFRKVYDAERPYTLYDFEPIVKKNKTGHSMPSRHVFSGAIIAMAFLYVLPLCGALIFVCTVLMCFGRVIAGVHFPKDVIVGFLAGVFCGIIGFYVI